MDMLCDGFPVDKNPVDPCFPRILGVDSTLEFADKIVAEAGIMIAPSHVFDYGDQHFRMGFGRENFGEVLGLFGDYVDKNL